MRQEGSNMDKTIEIRDCWETLGGAEAVRCSCLLEMASLREANGDGDIGSVA